MYVKQLSIGQRAALQANLFNYIRWAQNFKYLSWHGCVTSAIKTEGPDRLVDHLVIN
jgi:hypothetical protein